MPHTDHNDPREVVEHILEQPLPYLDLSILGEADLAGYAQEAKSIMDSRVFEGEVNRLIESCGIQIARYAKDYEEVRDMRMQITALALLRDRLRFVSNYRLPEEKKASDPHAQI